jgi:alanine racemase
MISHRPTWALINLDALRANMRLIKERIGAERRFMGIVKANAYGHGALEVARAAQEEGAAMLGVATVDEAVALRRLGFHLPIIILGPVFPQDSEAILAHHITASLGSLEVARARNSAARKWKPRQSRGRPASRKAGEKIPVHIKVDTGMGRFGFWHEEMPGVLDALKGMRFLHFEGIFTHFSESDAASRAFTLQQLKHFNRVLEMCRARSLDPPIKHAANSGAVLQYPEAWFDIVRPGIILYGLYPSMEVPRTLSAQAGLKIHPVMTLVSKVVLLRDVGRGRYLSYARTYRTKSRRRIATIPIGYGDGYPRQLSNRGYMIIRGQKAPIVGRVTMDQILLDVTTIPKVAVGDDVLIYGKRGKDYIPIEEVAASIGAISYELVCAVTQRVPRVYDF